MVYGELGRCPIFVSINKIMVGYWSRVVQGKETKLSRKIYECMYRLHTEGKYSSPWLLHIKNVLNHCGLSHVWLDQEIVNFKWLKMVVEQRHFAS